MDEIKKKHYEELVEQMKRTYPQFDYSFDPSDNSITSQFWSPYLKIDDEMTCICNEINLYTYWQGLGYAEKTPKIKYLLVGQDWGNPFLPNNKAFINRIIAMNNGNKNIPYIDSNDKIYSTDENLIELFKVLGYSDIANNCYEDLFFTNFCLAYRTGEESGNVPNDIMKKSAPLFKELCEILEPENILCLGQDTFKCVYKTLTNNEAINLDSRVEGKWQAFLDNHDDIIVNCGTFEKKIYPLAHCGTYGSMNRRRGLTEQSDPLYYQKQDWSKIIKDNR